MRRQPPPSILLERRVDNCGAAPLKRPRAADCDESPIRSIWRLSAPSQNNRARTEANNDGIFRSAFQFLDRLLCVTTYTLAILKLPGRLARRQRKVSNHSARDRCRVHALGSLAPLLFALLWATARTPFRKRAGASCMNHESAILDRHPARAIGPCSGIDAVPSNCDFRQA